MKTIVLVFVAFIFLFVSCKKGNSEVVGNLDVAKYVELLKTNQYNSSNIPAFTSNDIPLLLAYRNDNHLVRIFPANLVSSYAPFEPNYRLGVLVLWTIESIRAVSIQSQNLVGRFPSQNPFIAKRSNPSEWVLDYDNEAYTMISQAYFDWWESNRHLSFDLFKGIDPLKDTGYKWH
jgi:hypothetical protein